MASLRADRRLYLAADQQTVVEDGDPRAAFLLATPGTEISEADAKRLGLSEEEGQVTGVLPLPEAQGTGEMQSSAAQGEAEGQSQEADAKRRKGKTEDKERKPEGDKGK
jgi:hypothetical protein